MHLSLLHPKMNWSDSDMICHTSSLKHFYVSTVSQWPSDALNTETKINKWERWNKEQTGAEENLNFNVKSSEIRENIA